MQLCREHGHVRAGASGGSGGDGRLLPLITEWKNIYCPARKKVLCAFTYPLFVFSFGLAMVLAVFGNIQWQPIPHTVAVSIGDMGPRRRK